MGSERSGQEEKHRREDTHTCISSPSDVLDFSQLHEDRDKEVGTLSLSFFLAMPHSRQDPSSSALEAQNSNHWPARELQTPS